MDLTQIKPFLDSLGVMPWMYPVAVAVGILNQYAKGMLQWWKPEVSFGLAALTGMLCGVGAFVWAGVLVPECALRGLILMVACLVTESAMDAMAAKVPWIPKNNQWADKTPPTDK